MTTPITEKKKVKCPECESGWWRIAKKASALLSKKHQADSAVVLVIECRTCNCQFTLNEENVKIIQHGATYTGGGIKE